MIGGETINLIIKQILSPIRLNKPTAAIHLRCIWSVRRPIPLSLMTELSVASSFSYILNAMIQAVDIDLTKGVK
ncbi:hypothetical protein LC20_02736 [Yersinia hibernica]|uniref:Uncharacterized protein n=1 Tax=Yersinia enterocolitica LC20 TaxID=1443113 RepID=A0A7U4GFJ0_YEREN|nr:hypothetical protein LC20_02736 [Yersinia hibernica]OVZ77452.1 hypothetical protein CBW54_21240 [Yersinia kristensenii]